MRNITNSELRQLNPNQRFEAFRLLTTSMPADEMMTVEELEHAYVDSAVPEPSAVLLQDQAPVAVMLGEWFADDRLLLLAYMAVRRDRRGIGLGSHLLTRILPEWWSGRADVLVVAEVDDPRAHPGGPDVGDADDRLRFYERHGARMLPVPYFQPSLRPELRRVPGMLLLRLDGNGVLSPDIPRVFMEEYFRGCEGPDALLEDAVMKQLAAVAALADPGALWSPSRYRDMPT